MKTIILSILGVSIATSSYGQRSPMDPRLWFDLSDTAIAAKHPEVFDGLMIITALGPVIGHPAPGCEDLAVQKVRVEDSRAFSPGTVVDLYLPTTAGSVSHAPVMGVPLDQTGALPVGTRALVIARVGKNGKLLIPAFGGSGMQERVTVALGVHPAPSAYGMGIFRTSRLALSSDADPKWRLIESLAAAIPESSEENVLKITEIIGALNPQEAPGFGRPDDRFSRTLVNAVARDTAYHRTLVDIALNHLRYWGYRDRFFRDIQQAATDPNAFPKGIPSLDFEEDPGTGNNPYLPKDFKHDPALTQAQIVALLKTAKSTTIASGYLRGLTQKPAAADVRAMARFLDSPDPRLRRAFVERLCAWNGEPAPAKPMEGTGPDGNSRTEYPGLDEMVARWKARLKS